MVKALEQDRRMMRMHLYNPTYSALLKTRENSKEEEHEGKIVRTIRINRRSHSKLI